MLIFETRYAAKKFLKENPFHSSAEKIVKVCGGYTVMTEWDYRVWKNQK